MGKPAAIAGLLLGLAILVGCKKETGSTAAPSRSSPPPVTTTPPNAVVPSTAAVSNIQTPGSVGSPATPTISAPPSTPTTLPSLPGDSNTAITTTPTIGASPDDAKVLLADADKNITAKNWNGAKDDFKKLNSMRGKLSPELQQQVKDLEEKFVVAKAGASLKGIPGLGGATTTPAPEPEPNK